MSRPLATAAIVTAAVAAVAVVAGAVVLTRGRCPRNDRAAGAAAGAAVTGPPTGPPTGQYPCQYRRGRFKVFAEDATDKGGSPNYDPTALQSLDWLCIDVTPTAYARCSATLAMLPATTKLAVHPNLGGTDVFGTGTTLPEWAAFFAQLLDTKCPGLRERTAVILIETEALDDSKLYPALKLNGLYSTDYAALVAGFRAAGFTGLIGNGVAQYATDPSNFTHVAYPNIVLEAYNLWGRLCDDPPRTMCKVDFNNANDGSIKFPGATCGPGGYVCPSMGCPPGKGLCVTRPLDSDGDRIPCDATSAYGGGVYDPTLGSPGSPPWTAYQRGEYFGSVLADNWAQPRLVGSTFGPTPPALERFIVFSFTDASCPTLYGVITTSDAFDQFVQGFEDTLAAAKVLTYDQMGAFVYGAWGVPAWLRLQ